MKIVTVVGARPQFVKAAAVSRAIVEHNNINPTKKITEIIIHTGQHYDVNMSDIFFDEMEIPKPDYSLGVGGGTHGAMTGRQLEKIEAVLMEERPDYILVYGDTNSTLAGALAAAKMHIPVAHVEAGLRSFNMKMPEEVNRILTDQVSDLLFCPTDTALANLDREGFSDKACKIEKVGDVMLDAAFYYKPKARRPTQLSNINKPFALMTIHRAENTDDPVKLTELVSAVNEVSEQFEIICPIHPRTKKAIETLGLEIKAHIIEPVGYFEMLWLITNCEFIMTDSGGLQKEAYFFRKPCLTLRDQTEWVELVEAGVNKLVRIDRREIIQNIQGMCNFDPNLFEVSALYGDGKAGSKIIEIISKEFY
ncbi:UDP-N-acetylglucosamine 2-epimerase (non-hydrolyzing) [Vibrio sp. CUB2]|uniref:non-hydrolyzing UDP-N-acetylglucosamine 2-epimerase n=1 Tax=Vibrio sp. CUB2 TaxID=2315233 RepID=UPI00076A87BA|nr:UDP-N-acetylglucosamine 2-epimerase (non-hydrolyzing) [Vibrio sp. CUB2]